MDTLCNEKVGKPATLDEESCNREGNKIDVGFIRTGEALIEGLAPGAVQTQVIKTD